MHIKKGRNIYRLYDINESKTMKDDVKSNPIGKNTFNFKFSCDIFFNKWLLLLIPVFVAAVTYFFFV